MKINSIKPTTFGYKSVLKTEWLKGNMPSVTKGIYGGILTVDNITLEHIIPRSMGGKTKIGNLALATDVSNWQRSSKPFIDYFDEDACREYLEQFKDIVLPGFYGKQYIRAINNTISRMLKQR